MKEIALVHAASAMSGVEFSTYYLIEHLDRSSWTPLVICPEEGDLPTRARQAGAQVAVVPRASFLSTSARIAGHTLLNPLALIANLGALVSSARSLSKFLKARRPALVVTKGMEAHFYGGLAARWEGIPCVWHVQDRVSERAGKLFPWTLAAAGRIFASQVIVDAESIAKQLAPIVPASRVSLILNGVDTQEFSPSVDGSSVRAEWKAEPGDLLIGMIGRLTPWKGQRILIQAFARIADRVPHSRVVLVGSSLFDTSEFARALRAEVARFGLEKRVIFAGFRWDMPQVLAALDIVAHTSLEKDSSPLAVVSAMAAGKPIVCTRVDGTAQLFEEGVDGLLVPPGDVEALAEKLILLSRETDLARRLGQAARAKAENELSVEGYTLRCEQVFEKALETGYSYSAMSSDKSLKQPA